MSRMTEFRDQMDTISHKTGKNGPGVTKSYVHENGGKTHFFYLRANPFFLKSTSRIPVKVSQGLKSVFWHHSKLDTVAQCDTLTL